MPPLPLLRFSPLAAADERCWLISLSPLAERRFHASIFAAAIFADAKICRRRAAILRHC